MVQSVADDVFIASLSLQKRFFSVVFMTKNDIKICQDNSTMNKKPKTMSRFQIDLDFRDIDLNFR